MENKAKFFDKPLPLYGKVVITERFNDLKQCLESEGVVLTVEDVIRSFDMYIRILGLDRKVSDDGLKSIYSWFGLIDIKELGDDTPNEVFDAFSKAFENINELADEDAKIEDISIITSNIKTVLKEYAIFFNEILLTIAAGFEEIKVLIKLEYATTIGEDRLFSITCGFAEDIKQPVYEILSTVVSKTLPNEKAVIVNTFDGIKDIVEEEIYKEVTGAKEENS